MRPKQGMWIAGLLCYACAAAAAGGGAPSGKQIASQGNGKGATACMTCHGMDGAGQPAAGFPKLSNLSAGYIESQLQSFQKGTRQNPIMAPNAKALSGPEIKAVAEYYAGQKSGTSKAAQPKSNPELIKQGRALANRGDWENGVPACFSCHGPGAQGVGDQFPALAGQHASYITAQITAWKKGQRTNDPVELMKTVASRLSQQQTSAVAAYLASLGPQQKGGKAQ